MNKQKIIEAIEANKDKYKYIKKTFWNHDRTGCCTMGLLSSLLDPNIMDVEDSYDLNMKECEWIVKQNDNHCDSFDCMITAIRGYEDE
jgi:hypothetical protein